MTVPPATPPNRTPRGMVSSEGPEGLSPSGRGFTVIVGDIILVVGIGCAVLNGGTMEVVTERSVPEVPLE